MALTLRNTLSGKRELFEPLGSTVTIYSCGPTVYDLQTIGNLRGILLANTLRRALEAAAKKMGKHTQEIAGEITRLYFADLDALGIDRGSMQFPRATQYITEQIKLVETLLQKGYAYKISDGIYFDISKYQDYGRLGNINVRGEEAG